MVSLGFGFGHDLAVREFEPGVRLCADSEEPARDSLSVSVSATFPTHALSLKNKYTNVKKKKL